MYQRVNTVLQSNRRASTSLTSALTRSQVLRKMPRQDSLRFQGSVNSVADFSLQGSAVIALFLDEKQGILRAEVKLHGF